VRWYGTRERMKVMILMNGMIEIQHAAWMKLMSTSIRSYLEDWGYIRFI
jgi:hypothetical protein